MLVCDRCKKEFNQLYSYVYIHDEGEVSLCGTCWFYLIDFLKNKYPPDTRKTSFYDPDKLMISRKTERDDL